MLPQFAARPFGMLFGLHAGYHAFTHRPTFRKLKGRTRRSRTGRDGWPTRVCAAILAEADPPTQPVLLFDSLFAFIQHSADSIYAIGDPPDYEPTRTRRSAIARSRGEDPLATMYDLMLESDGTAMLMLPFFNYVGQPRRHPRDDDPPAAVSGLSDGGAHCGLICDASLPTFLLTHWAGIASADRGSPLEYVVRKQTPGHRKPFRPPE